MVLWFHPAYSSVEFNTAVLDVEERDNIDLSRFSNVDFVMPGDYLLEIKINNKKLPEQTIQYLADPKDPKISRACLPAPLVDKLALKKSALEKISYWNNNRCADISAIEGATINNQIGQGLLAISIPQAWMKYQDDNWTPPEQWDDGIPGLLLDYNINAQVGKRQHNNNTAESVSTYGTLGANAGAWRLRANYQASMNQDSGNRRTDARWNQIYAFRPLPMQSAKLMVGELYLDSNIFDSYGFTGGNLASDERMLPPNLQGYAPEVRGVAKSNAKVTVSQQDRVLYETTVPAGPFVIQDLSSAVRGHLDVKVEEQDGTVSTFEIDTASIPYLTRPGYLRYNLAFGKPSTYEHRLQGPLFVSSDFSWGASNAWSLYGGTLLAGNYNSWAFGAGRDLNDFGALSVDMTQSLVRLPNQGNTNGLSFKVNYAKRFDSIDSQITFAGYRFSQRKFMSMPQYLETRHQSKNRGSNQEKQLYTITASKTFWADQPDRAITAYLNFNHQTYWNAESQNRYGTSVSKVFDIGGVKRVSASLSAYRTSFRDNIEDSVMLNISMPLADRKYVSYTLQQDSNKISQTATYSDYSNRDTTWQLSSGLNQSGKGQVRGYMTQNLPYGVLSTTAAYEQNSYTSLGGTFRGGITATQYGAAFHRNGSPGSSRMLLDTTNVKGVPIQGGRAVTNRYGLAVLADLNSYYNIDARIDVNALADDVEAHRAVVQGTMTEGAIGYRRFDVAQGTRLFAVLRLQDGGVPPFGAVILNAKGREMAIVDEGGSVYISGVQPDETLQVAWAGKNQCGIQIPATATSMGQVLLPCVTQL